MSCSICCEKFNKSTRCEVKCKSCKDDTIVACRSCAKRYILDQPTDASCMICRVEWDTEFLTDNFTKNFVNKELKSHREDYLFDKQVVLLPETQVYAEKLKMIEKLEKERLALEIKRDSLREKLKKIQRDITEMNRIIYDARNDENSVEAETSRNKLSIKCPIDNCNGFLNNKYHCGICENDICKDCMEIKTEDHECNEEKKETMKTIRQDTKPCPKCGQRIHKLPHGCDQMYCVNCHTAFSWRTGQIDRGHIHNPEYFRWLRENGKEVPRNPLDIVHNPCDTIIRITEFIRILRGFLPATVTTRGYHTEYLDASQTIVLTNMHRMHGHITHINRLFEEKTNNNNHVLKEMRAYFILGKLTKEEFKKKIQMLEKKMDKLNRINNVWILLKYGIIEYINKVTNLTRHNRIEGINKINEIITESESIKEYCNKSFKKIGESLNMTYPGITDNWIQVENWELYIKRKNRT